MESGEIIQILVQAGAVGIVFGFMYYSYQKDKLYNKTLNNHLEHTHVSDIELAKQLEGLKGVIEQANTNHINIVSVLDTNARTAQENMRMLDRLEGKLDQK